MSWMHSKRITLFDISKARGLVGWDHFDASMVVNHFTLLFAFAENTNANRVRENAAGMVVSRIKIEGALRLKLRCGNLKIEMLNNNKYV